MKQIISITVLFLISLTSLAQYNPPYNEEYTQTYLPSIEIVMDTADYNWMVDPANIWSDNYQQATATYKGSNNLIISYDTLGIRLRGNTSRSKDKKSFKIHFEKFTNNQFFFDLKKMNLKAETNDPSVIREHLVMNMYKTANVPVARVNHIKVYINSNYMGLYSSIEQIDSRFLESRFNNKEGNLYKCGWGADLANMNEVYNDGIYELKTNETINDRTNLSNFITFLTTSSNSDFETNIESYINVDSYLKQLAIEVLTGHWDAYSYNMNNYYLYYNTDLSWFEYIPYDADNTVGIDWVNRDWSDRSIYDWARHGNNPRPLHNRILNIEKYKKVYSQNIDSFIKSFYNVSTQISLANQYHLLISNAVNTDTYYPRDFGFTYTNFEESISQNISGTQVKYGIEPFIYKRVNSAVNQLDPIYLTIRNNDLVSSVKFYPNPVSRKQKLTIETNTSSPIYLRMYNSVGHLVLNQESSKISTGLDISNLHPGVYYIQFSNSTNQVSKPVIIY